MSSERDIVTVEASGEIVVFHVNDASIDLRNAKNLQRQIIEQAGTIKKAIIDLSKVEFIDSAGLGTLISTLRHFLAASGDLRLAGPTLRMQVLLEVTRLERVFSVFPDVASAANGFV